MIDDQVKDQPIAGPSTIPYSPPKQIFLPTPVRSTASSSSATTCPFGAQCPLLVPISSNTHRTALAKNALPRPSKLEQVAWYEHNYRRQGNPEETLPSVASSESYNQSPAAGTAGSTSAIEASSSSSSSSSYAPLFTGPSSSASVSFSSSYNSSAAYPTGSSTGFSDVDTYTSSLATSSSYYRSTSFTSLWSYSATKSRTSSAATPTQSVYVSGVLLNLTLGGDSDTEAIYSVQVDFGHDISALNRRARRRGLRRRGPSSNWNGKDIQVVNLQVDLGSSDMWVASSDCVTQPCREAKQLFNITESLESGVSADITYQSGAVSGEIYWEEIGIGGYGIGFQAFIGGTNITNEDLKGGEFDGVLGLALPASSTILQTIGGTTGSNPDGATFLDNLFGAGADAPSERLFALSLERREDVRTTSTFSIGTVDQSYCPSPCQPPYTPIVSQPQLGATGYLHWRIPIQSLSITTWEDQQHGSGAQTTVINLGASQVYPQKATPLAVLDSGGVQILVGYRPYADLIYSAIGVSQSADGLYRLPCKQQLALTLNIGGQSVPVHPLDMTYPDPDDASQTTCIGMIQYSSNLGESGDFILGSSFLKNVYSIYQYPDTNGQKIWQPTIGLVPLTNASIASQDFYAVRVQRQSLSSVSADQQAEYGGGSSNGNPGSQPSEVAAQGKKAVSSAAIAASSVVGFFVIAAAAFCAWWFWLRRKFGAGGVVEYKSARRRPSVVGHESDGSLSSLRHKKHSSTQRQRSMVEGYADFEGDSWRSMTEGDDSIRLGYLPEVAEEDEGRPVGPVDKRSSRGSILPGEQNGEPGYELVDLHDPSSPTAATATRVQTLSPGPISPLVRSPTEIEPSRSANPQTSALPAASYPKSGNGPSTSASSRTLSMSMSGPFPSPGVPRMSGPFPSPGGNRQSTRLDASPMYDIRTSDYFSVPVPSTSSTNQQRGREHRRGSSSAGVDGRRESSSGIGGNGRRKSSPSKGGGAELPVFEEGDGEERRDH